MDAKSDSGYQRLEEQILWYDRKSITNQRWYRGLKLLEIACAALIAAIAPSYPIAASVMGVVIVILEGIQHLFQYNHNWATYRSTCEALKHEKYLFLGLSGPYDLPEDEARKLLVERTEGLISTEHAKWVSSRAKADKAPKKHDA